MSRLFKPLSVGSSKLNHRVALAPLTRFRADDDFVPLPMVKEYYEQRASVPGTLLVTEATVISKAAVGYPNAPGIFTDAQIASWKQVTDAVHKKGSFIYCQLWHLGRVASPQFLEQLGTKLVSASAVALNDTYQTPAAMTEEEILATIGDYATAAENAMAAGFDGVEIHGANGYLIDQFIQDTVNKRTDAWGGSIEKRSRFALEVTKAVVDAVGADKVAIRLSPYGEFQVTRMEDPTPPFEHIVGQLSTQGLAYIHLVDPRAEQEDVASYSLESLIKLIDNRTPVVIASGFSRESAVKTVDEAYKDYDVIIAFGRHFIANPDLAFRLKEDLELNKYNRSTFYAAKQAEGYTDYPFSEKFTV